MVDGTGTTSYSYHAAGQPGAGQVAGVDGPLANDTITYGYDELGRVTTRAINGSANPVTWAFDALGRVTTETNLLGTFAYTYDGATARLATVTYPNGQTSTYSYLAATQERRLQTIHHLYPSTATLSKFDYAYDAVGNILTWQQQADSAAPTLWRYGYDRADQLVRAVQETTGGTPTILHAYAYGYDPAGNRLYEQIDTDVTAWTYTNLNRLQAQAGGGVLQIRGTVNEPATVTVQGVPAAVSSAQAFQGGLPVVPGTNVFTVAATDGSGNVATAQYEVDVTNAPKTFTYDANGNLTSDGTRTFEWDALNQMVAMTEGTGRTELRYDGLRRRIRTTRLVNAVVVEDRALVTCEGIVCEEREAASNTVLRRPLSRGEQLNGTTSFSLFDHLNSLQATTDVAGAVVSRSAYDPFGRREESGSQSVQSFAGLRASESGIALSLSRAYDPTLGHWLSEDPLVARIMELHVSDPDQRGIVPRLSVQQYSYVESRVTTLLDPSGLIGSGEDCSNQSPRCDSYAACDQYQGANARCFCRCASNGRWSSYTRCCLFDLYLQGYGSHDAHVICYARATLRHPLSMPPRELLYCYAACRVAQSVTCNCSRP